MYTYDFFHRALASCLCFSLAAALPAAARDNEAQPAKHDAVTLETITVTATRTARPVFDTAAAVSVLDSDAIAQSQAYGYGDVFAAVPGVAIQGGPRRIAEEPAIRGFTDERVVVRTDDSLELELGVYHSRVNDFVDEVVTFISGAPTFDPATATLVFPGTTTTNSVPARFKGAEATLRYQRHDWSGELSVSHVQAEDRTTGIGLAGIQADHLSVEIGRRLTPLNISMKLRFSADRRVHDVPEGALTTPGHGKLDLFAHYAAPEGGWLAGLDLRFGIDNLLDKSFRIHPNAIEQPGRSVARHRVLDDALARLTFCAMFPGAVHPAWFWFQLGTKRLETNKYACVFGQYVTNTGQRYLYAYRKHCVHHCP